MVAFGWRPDQFRFETVAHRDDYQLTGEDNQYVDSKVLKELGLPEILCTSFDVEAAWHKVKAKFPVSFHSETVSAGFTHLPNGRIGFIHIPLA